MTEIGSNESSIARSLIFFIKSGMRVTRLLSIPSAALLGKAVPYSTVRRFTLIRTFNGVCAILGKAFLPISYYTEYDVYPVPRGTGKIDTYYADNAAAWGPMTIALCGLTDPAHPEKKIDPATAVIPNDRGIAFLALSRSVLDVSSGIGVPKFSSTDWYGKPRFFCMAIDSNYDGVLGDKDQAAGKLPDFANGLHSGGKISEGVAVWADGNASPSDHDNLNFWAHTY